MEPAEPSTIITLSSILAILKFVSILIAGILGATNLLVKFKDADGQITKWGRIALFGTITASVIAIFVQGLDEFRTRSKANQERQRIETLLKGIDQNLTRIGDARLDISIDFAEDEPAIHKLIVARNKLGTLSEDELPLLEKYDRTLSMSLEGWNATCRLTDPGAMVPSFHWQANFNLEPTDVGLGLNSYLIAFEGVSPLARQSFPTGAVSSVTDMIGKQLTVFVSTTRSFGHRNRAAEQLIQRANVRVSLSIGNRTITTDKLEESHGYSVLPGTRVFEWVITNTR